MKRQNLYWLSLNAFSIVLAAVAFWAIYNRVSIAVIPSFSILIGEIVACLSIALLVRRFGKITVSLSAIVIFAILLIDALQTLSIAKSGALLDMEAFANVEHIGFMIDALSISIAAIFLFFGAIAVWFLLKAPRIAPAIGCIPFVSAAILLIATNSAYFLKIQRYSYPANKISYTASLIKTLSAEREREREREYFDNVK
jgi:hypothetical protein